MAGMPPGIATVPKDDPDGDAFARADAGGDVDPAAVRASSPIATGAGASLRAVATDPAEGPIAPLVRETAESWHQGACHPVEDYLARLPEHLDPDEAATRLIVEEIRLRRELGYETSTTGVMQRFPQWEARLDELTSLTSLGVQVPPPAPLPAVGEVIGEFRLRATLGRGAQGRVFLAVQPDLANRPVVLKITPRQGSEHLTLARLQHAHIVPLYWVQDLADRDLRVLCMPYLGGATLARVLSLVEVIPPERRTGRDLLDALDRIQAEVGAEATVALPVQGPARKFLAQASYIQAVCWIGACLADALHFAHQRELLHLDLKPPNILLAADGTPMLLDFHLAQPPIRSGSRGPAQRRLGGTPAYMSPEQWAALSEARSGRTVAIEVDGRSDIYSLGRLLHEALGGKVPANWWIPIPLPTARQALSHPQIPSGLRDILARCLEVDPRDRYPDAARLAEDLRRHLADLPLRGVANRSWAERWRKWRRRRPHALGRIATCVVAAAALLLAGLVAVVDVRQRLRRAEAALAEGRTALDLRDFPGATRALERGLAITDPSQDPALALVRHVLPAPDDLRRTLGERLRLARSSQTAEEIHGLIDRLRLLSGADPAATGPLRAPERRLGATWEARRRILARLGGDLAPPDAERLRADLLELGICWARLRVRLATATGPAVEVGRRRRDALRVLEEAEALFGPHAALERERQSYAEALGLTDLARAAARRRDAMTPSTAWEHYVLGRSLLDAGDWEAAAREFAAAADLRPQDLWPHFCQGLCAYHMRRLEAAVAAFDVCVALAPNTAERYYNRARAHGALGRVDRALSDYDRALRLAPDLAIAALNRGVLHYREWRYPEAIADFRQALAGGAPPSSVHYNLALAHRARGDIDAARASLDTALRLEPDQADFRGLERRLRNERPGR